MNERTHGAIFAERDYIHGDEGNTFVKGSESVEALKHCNARYLREPFKPILVLQLHTVRLCKWLVAERSRWPAWIERSGSHKADCDGGGGDP